MCPPTNFNIYITEMLKLVANLELLQRKTHLPQASIACIADQFHLIPVNVHLCIYDVHGLHIQISIQLLGKCLPLLLKVQICNIGCFNFAHILCPPSFCLIMRQTFFLCLIMRHAINKKREMKVINTNISLFVKQRYEPLYQAIVD